MIRFTDSPYEYMMRQIPVSAKPSVPAPPSKPHLCNGCKRYGEGCIHPCYREVKEMEDVNAPDRQ